MWHVCVFPMIFMPTGGLTNLEGSEMGQCEPVTAITQGSSAVGINYDNANRRTSLTLPNGVTVGYSVDNDSRITGLTYSAGSTQLGNPIYGYDADGRVTSKNGTLAAISLPNSVSGNTFNADNGMTGFNGTTLTYDANGNLTNDGTNTYTWDARNHLTGISGAVAMPASCMMRWGGG